MIKSVRFCIRNLNVFLQKRVFQGHKTNSEMRNNACSLLKIDQPKKKFCNILLIFIPSNFGAIVIYLFF